MTLFVRGKSLEKGMSDYLIQHIRSLDNVTVKLHTEVIDGAGEAGLERIVVRDLERGVTEVLPGAPLFVLIGAEPHTAWLIGAVQRDDRGYICTGPDVTEKVAGCPQDWIPTLYESSIPGVFAIGDVRLGSTKRLAAAVGEGAAAIQAVHRYLDAPVLVEPVRLDPELAAVVA